MNSELPESALTRIYPKGSGGHRVQVLAGVFSVLLLLCTLVAVVCAERSPCHRPGALIILTGVWGFAPPVWAWFEFFYIFPKFGNKGALDTLKYGHQVSLAIWAAVAVGLGAYASRITSSPSRARRSAHTTRVMAANKQLQRTVERCRGRGASSSLHFALAPRWLAQRAAAELRR